MSDGRFDDADDDPTKPVDHLKARNTQRAVSLSDKI